MQAQDLQPARWSIAQRTTAVTDHDVLEALGSGAVIRTHLLRPTWHFVAGEDLRWLLALTGPRILKGQTGRRNQLELDEHTLARAEKVIVRALEGRDGVTRNEIGDVLTRANVDPSGQRLPHILMHCELRALICSGVPQRGVHTYALVDDRVPPSRNFDRDEALAELVRRYLDSHGPACVEDVGWWASLTTSDVKRALHLLGDDVASETLDGMTLWSAGSEPAPARRGTHLLQTFDEMIVGYTKSRFFGDPRAVDARAAWGDRTKPRGLLVHDTLIAGRWRVTRKTSALVEVLVYDDASPSVGAALERAAAAYGRFSGLPSQLRILPSGGRRPSR